MIGCFVLVVGLFFMVQIVIEDSKVGFDFVPSEVM